MFGAPLETKLPQIVEESKGAAEIVPDPPVVVAEGTIVVFP